MAEKDLPPEEAPQETPEERKRRKNIWLIVALVAAVAAGLLLASTVWQSRWSSPENAVGNDLVAAQAADPEKLCASQATYDAIRRELFRRAAHARGSDEQAFARLSDFAMLRVSGPIVREVDEDVERVTCSGTAFLDLPPGVEVQDNRRSLSGDLDYLVQPAADGTGNVVRLGNADAIVVPLATLSRIASAQLPQMPQPDSGGAAAPFGEPEPAPVPTPQPTPQPQPQPQRTANPSFDCSDARTRSEVAVCNDPGLASLDRQMASQFRNAQVNADRSQRRLLERTRGRFLNYRERCGSNACIAETYRSRMREIQDIMADRWRG